MEDCCFIVIKLCLALVALTSALSLLPRRLPLSGDECRDCIAADNGPEQVRSHLFLVNLQRPRPPGGIYFSLSVPTVTTSEQANRCGLQLPLMPLLFRCVVKALSR